MEPVLGLLVCGSLHVANGHSNEDSSKDWRHGAALSPLFPLRRLQNKAEQLCPSHRGWGGGGGSREEHFQGPRFTAQSLEVCVDFAP